MQSHIVLKGCAVLVLCGLAYGLWQWRKQRIYEASSPVERGWILIADKGCADCHQPGNSFRAPELAGLMGQTVKLQDGSEITVDAEYIKAALFSPQKHVRQGYQAVMPSYEGRLSPSELEELLAALGATPQSP